MQNPTIPRLWVRFATPFSQEYLLIFFCLDIFLQINDQINTVLNRYDAFKKGDFTAAANPIPAELGGYVYYSFEKNNG